MADPSADKAETECCYHQRSFLCWRIWTLYALLATIGIPWYWPKEHATQLLGLPAWTCVSLLASLGASVLTTWLILTHWPAAPDEDNKPASDPS